MQWEDIVRGLVKDVIEELELECEELWTSCQRDGEKIRKLMQEMREQCTQCVEEYKKNWRRIIMSLYIAKVIFYLFYIPSYIIYFLSDHQKEPPVHSLHIIHGMLLYYEYIDGYM